MAEGSYGSSPFYQAAVSPITSPASASAQYTANVSRKKTRKWVEAKTLNYDGSGWGDEDDDDDDDDDDNYGVSDPAAAQRPPMPSGIRALPSVAAAAPPLASPLSGVTASVAPAAAAAPMTHRPRQDSLSARPALYVQTGPTGTGTGTGPSGLSTAGPLSLMQTTALPSGQGSPALAVAHNNSPRAPPTRSGSMPPIAPRQPWVGEGRSQSPLGPRAQSPAAAAVRRAAANAAAANAANGANNAQPGGFVRPADIYRRTGTPNNERAQSTPPRGRENSVPTPVSTPPLASTPAAAPPPPTAPVLAGIPGPSYTPVKAVAAALPSSTLSREAKHTPQASVDSVAESTTGSVTGSAASADDDRRFSNFPKLPNLARFSTFAPDLLFSDSGFLSDVPPMPGLPATVPGTSVTATPAAAVPAAAAAALSESTRRPTDSFSSAAGSVVTARDSSITTATAITAFSDESAAQTEDKERAESVQITPTVTPTVTPTAPLNPHRGNPAPVDTAALALPRSPASPGGPSQTGTSTTASSATAKDSDKLHEEIIRSLSSAKTITAAIESGTPTTEQSDHEEGNLTRESSYLQSVYDEYWTPDDGSVDGEPVPPMPPMPLIPKLTPPSTKPEQTAAPAVELPEAASAVAELTPDPTPDPTPKTTPRLPAPEPPPAAVPHEDLAIVSPLVSPGNGPGSRGTSPGGECLSRQRFSWEAGSAAAGSDAAAPPVTAAAAARMSVEPPIPLDVEDPRSPVKEAVSPGEQSLVSPVAEAVPEVAWPVKQPLLRSMLDVGDEPVVAATPAVAPPTVQIAPPEEEALPASPTTEEPTHMRESVLSARSAQSTQSAQSSQSSSATQPAPQPATTTTTARAGTPTTPTTPSYTYAHEGSGGPSLTLRQCMAFSTHAERMAKLAETRHEYATADSGLLAWLGAMTGTPEYARASYVPLWETAGGATGGVAAPRPMMAPHVNIPSSAQISHKGKEILAATGKAGKGLFSLRKKGFHKK